MRTMTTRRLDDLASVLRQVCFDEGHAVFRESRLWRVFAYPRPGKKDRFDALLGIIPRRGGERLGEDLTMTLNGRGSFWLASERTDSRGTIWFHDLPAGEYVPHLATMPLPDARGPNERSTTTGKRNLNRQAKPSWPTYVLHDRRISASLQMASSGAAILKWKTTLPELAGMRIAFQIAGETGEVELHPKGRSPRPSAEWKLQQSYHDIAGWLPQFKILRRRPARRT